MAHAEQQLRVLVAGGGIAAAETVIALRALAGERVAITLLSPSDELVYRPLEVLTPFARRELRSWPLAALARDFDVDLRRGALEWVAPSGRRAFTSDREEISYDVLVVATGARRVAAFDDALTFRGAEDAAELRLLVDAVQTGAVRRVAFVVPDADSWSLPLYELALMTAARAADAGATGVELTLVTPEESPLALFGDIASGEVAALLDSAGVSCVCGSSPEVPDRTTVVAGGQRIECDRVVALPRLFGPSIRGLPRGEDGFLRVTPFGHVLGVKDVYAAGDATSFPIKQGGVACQQADVVAQAIARRAGAEVTPTGYRPVLRGKLLTGERPRWLRRDGAASIASDHMLWWPPAKVAGEYLAPYLGEPSCPEEGPVSGRAVISTGRDRGEVALSVVAGPSSALARV